MTDNCIVLVKHFESLRLKAYLDPRKIPTIGYGTTIYPNGNKVKMGDTCTVEQANDWLRKHLQSNEEYLSDLSNDQTDALLSFIYNVGIGNYNISVLKRKVNKNPLDPTIEKEFMKWVYSGGVLYDGLVKRRKAEWILYSTGKINFI